MPTTVRVNKARGKPFAKGADSRRAFGRPKGAINTIGRELKLLIILAGDNTGNRMVDAYNANRKRNEPERDRSGLLAYLEWLAEARPQTFAGLLGRLLPLDFSARYEDDDEDPNEPITDIEELHRRAREQGLPQSVIQLLPKKTEDNGQ